VQAEFRAEIGMGGVFREDRTIVKIGEQVDPEGKRGEAVVVEKKEAGAQLDK
jgi:hypothetical protein